MVSERVVVYFADPAVAVTVTAEGGRWSRICRRTGGRTTAATVERRQPAANTTSMHRDSQRRRFFHQSPPSESTRTDGGNSGAGKWKEPQSRRVR